MPSDADGMKALEGETKLCLPPSAPSNAGSERKKSAHERRVTKERNSATGGAAIPMDHEDVYLVDIFRKAIGGRAGLDDFVFINSNTGRGYKAVTLNSIFRDAREKAGFLTITANEFGRHSFATRKIEEGWSFDHVSVFLLNSPEVVRKRYANVTRALYAPRFYGSMQKIRKPVPGANRGQNKKPSQAIESQRNKNENHE